MIRGIRRDHFHTRRSVYTIMGYPGIFMPFVPLLWLARVLGLIEDFIFDDDTFLDLGSGRSRDDPDQTVFHVGYLDLPKSRQWQVWCLGRAMTWATRRR